MPRLFRESPLNSIWEGCGNIQSLDILRAMQKSPDAAEALFADICSVSGSDSVFDKFTDTLKKEVTSTQMTPGAARSLASRLARAIQASLMIRYSQSDNAAYFIETRIATEHGIYGAHDAPGVVGNILDTAIDFTSA